MSINESFDEKACHIFLVNNDVKEYQPKQRNLSVIRSKPKIGFSRASNLGVYTAALAGFDKFMLLNQDCVIASDYSTILANKLQNLSSSENLFSPMIYNYNLSLLSQDFLFYLKGVSTGNEGTKSEELAVPVIPGVCWLFGLDFLKQNGMFDPYFYHYSEDIDFCERHKSPKIVITELKVGHFNGGPNDSYSLFRDYNYWLSKSKFYLRHGSWQEYYISLRKGLGSTLIMHKSMRKAIQFCLASLINLLTSHKAKKHDILAVKKRIKLQLIRDAQEQISETDCNKVGLP